MSPHECLNDLKLDGAGEGLTKLPIGRYYIIYGADLTIACLNSER